MKFAAIQIILFVLASVSATIVGSIPDSSWKRHENDKRIVTSDESHTSLQVQSRQAQVVIGVAALVVALGSWITQLAQGQTETAQPDPDQPQTGVQLVQASINQLETNNLQSGSPFNSIAIRLFVPQTSVNWDGAAGQDWGSNWINVNGSEGASTWVFFWFKTGSITIKTLTLSNDIAIGGLHSYSTDPTDPSLITIHFPGSFS